MTDLLVGIDVGTTAVKVAYLSASGALLDSRRFDLLRRQTFGDRSTQDPSEWLEAVEESVFGLGKPARHLRALGMCVNCSTLVPGTADGTLAGRDAVLWNDSSASAAAHEIEQALRRRGVDSRIRANEPCARFHQWLAADGDHTITFREAATWLTQRLTGQPVLPSSIYCGRWGQLAETSARQTLFEAYPNIEPLYRRALARITTWHDHAGDIIVPERVRRTFPANVPLFCAGNDGLTALFGSGYLHADGAEFFILGTAKLHVGSREVMTRTWPGSESLARLPDVDILFGRELHVHECAGNLAATAAARAAALPERRGATSPGLLCFVGGADDIASALDVDEPSIVRCGQFAGAVGAAALAGMASGILPRDPRVTSEWLRQNWRTAS